MVERSKRKDAYVEQGFDIGKSRRAPPRITESDGTAELGRASNRGMIESQVDQKMPKSCLDVDTEMLLRQLSLYPDAGMSKLLARIREGMNGKGKSPK